MTKNFFVSTNIFQIRFRYTILQFDYLVFEYYQKLNQYLTAAIVC